MIHANFGYLRFSICGFRSFHRSSPALSGVGYNIAAIVEGPGGPVAGASKQVKKDAVCLYLHKMHLRSALRLERVTLDDTTSAELHGIDEPKDNEPEADEPKDSEPQADELAPE
jgi:hypothetical protein